MNAHRDRSAARIMAAAISRRRALKGAAGAAALGLLGRRHWASGAVSGSLIDLSRAVLLPSDLPDGERFGLYGGITFFGPDGGEQSGVLDARRLDALGSARENLIGGHSVTLVPLTGPTDAWWTITFHQFTDVDQARLAFDGYREIFFVGTEDVTPDNDPAGYYWWTVPYEGSFVQTRAALVRSETVVTTLQGMTRHETEPPALAPPLVVSPLGELTKVSTGRLEFVGNNTYAGLGPTIPTWTDVATATEGRLGPGIAWWQQGYLQIDGQPVRWTSQTDEQYAQLQTHPGVTEALFRVETVGASPLIVRVDAYRFDDEDAASEFFVGIGARTAEAAATATTFDSAPLDPPETATSDRPTQAYWQSVFSDAGAISGVQTWGQYGQDVTGLLLALPACLPPATPEGGDPAADAQADDGTAPPDLSVIETLQAAGSTAADGYVGQDATRDARERAQDAQVAQARDAWYARLGREEDEADCALLVSGAVGLDVFCAPLMDEEGARRIRDRARS